MANINTGGANFIPTIWSARFLQALEDAYVYVARSNRNYEGEVRAAGDKVQIPSFTLNPTVRDYVVDRDIAAAEVAQGESQVLEIDQQKYFHLYVDDVDAAQAKPELMNESMRNAGIAVAQTLDDWARGLYNSALTTDNIQTDNRLKAAIDDAHIANVIDLGLKMDEAKIPTQGRWIAVHPQFMARLSKFFLDKGNAAPFTPATNDEVVRNGFVGRLAGFELYITNRVQGTTGNSATWTMIAGQGNEAFTYASQLTEVESYRPEKRFGDAVKGLYVYGGKIVLPARVFALRIKKDSATS